MTNAQKIVIGNPEGKRSLGKPRRGWEVSIGRLCGYGLDSITQDRSNWEFL
jgi:hypothetical protein